MLLVILYRTGLGIAPFGFLGIDVFFVISGYLITDIMTGGCAAATSVSKISIFVGCVGCFRRVRYPVADPDRQYGRADRQRLAEFRAATLRCPRLRSQRRAVAAGQLFQERHRARAVAAHVVAGSRGTILHRAPSGAAHPAATVACVAIVTIGSLGTYVWLYPHSPGAAFYFLPTRAWEIGIGAAYRLAGGVSDRRRPAAGRVADRPRCH